MRILFPVLVPFPSSDAPAVQVASMAQAFAELGHSVTLVTPVAGPPDERDVSRTLGRPARFLHRALSRRIHRGQSYLHAARIARLVRTGRPDLVFSRNLRACLVPALRGSPTVFEAHTLSSLTGPQERWVIRRLLHAPGFRGVVAISQALADDLVDEFGVARDRILVAHDAADLPVTQEHRTAGTAPSDGTFRVGYTGSLHPGKGADLLVEIAERCAWATFEIAGGPDHLAEALRRRTRAAGLTNVVVHGRLAPVDARALQASCDVLVAPFSRRVESDSGHDISRWTSPMKLFEYMAAGRPIVVGDLPVLHEVLRPDIDALMVPPEDPDALVDALIRLRDDPDLGARLSRSALERVRAEFTWEARARRILERFGA